MVRSKDGPPTDCEAKVENPGTDEETEDTWSSCFHRQQQKLAHQMTQYNHNNHDVRTVDDQWLNNMMNQLFIICTNSTKKERNLRCTFGRNRGNEERQTIQEDYRCRGAHRTAHN